MSFQIARAITQVMRFIQQRKFFLALAVVLFFSAVMAVRQYIENEARHAELREALILVQNRNHLPEAKKLCDRLFGDLRTLPTAYLINDLQRMSAIAPTNQSPMTNFIVRYHHFVTLEVRRRLEHDYAEARKLAEQEN